MRRKCEASLFVAASPETIWVVVSDVSRVGQWSGGCRGCTWLGDAERSCRVQGSKAATVGAGSVGRDSRGGQSRQSTRARLEDRSERSSPDSVEWHLGQTEEQTGARMTESFEVVSMPRLMEWSRSRSRCRRTEITPAI
jgi:hypothetical protein